MVSLEGGRFSPDPEVTYSKETISALPLIVLCGQMGSGKGTGAAFLQREFDFSHEVASTILRERSARLGINSPSRDQLNDMEEAIGRQYGKDGITRMILARIDRAQRLQPAPGVTIDGLRLKEEVELLRQFPRARVVWLDADPEIRFSRIITRNRANDLTDWEEFLVKDTQEAQGMEGVKELATQIIDANNPMRVVEEELRRIKDGL